MSGARVLAQTPADTPVPTEVPTEPEAAATVTAVPTEPPATAAATEVAAQPTPTAASTSNNDDNTNTWLIVAVIALIAIVIVGAIAMFAGRRGGGGASAATTTWQSRAGDTYGKAAALHDAIAVELVSSSPVSEDPAVRQRWQDIQRRIDDLTADLHALEAAPKNEEAAQSLRRMLATLIALRTATLPGAPAPSLEPPQPGQPTASEQQAAQIRLRLAEFDGDVRQFRTFI